MKTAVAYARFSTGMQREESIEAQFYDIAEFAKKHEIVLLNKFSDEAITGMVDNRDAFQEMIQFAIDNRVNYIITHKVDRFARNKYQSAIYKYRLKQKGIRVIYSEQFFSDNPEGELMEGILENMAHYYVQNAASESMKVLRLNARKAKFNGGYPPLGYWIDENKDYQIDEEEADIIRLIFELYRDRKGYASIVDILNANGYRNKQGRPFVFNSIRPILTNKKYIGTYEYNKTSRSYTEKGLRNKKTYNDLENMVVVEDALPAIIDHETFYRVQEILNMKKYNTKDRKNSRRTYLLKGLVYCGECGRIAPGSCQHGATKVYYYYRCKHCSITVNAEHLEAYVYERLTSHILKDPEELAKRVQIYYNENYLDIDKEKQLLELELKELERKSIIVAEMGLIEGADIMANIELQKQNVQRRNELTEKLQHLTIRSKIHPDDIRSWLLNLKANLDKKERLQEVFRTLIHRIEIFKDHIDIYYTFSPEESLSNRSAEPSAPIIRVSSQIVPRLEKYAFLLCLFSYLLVFSHPSSR